MHDPQLAAELTARVADAWALVLTPLNPAWAEEGLATSAWAEQTVAALLSETFTAEEVRAVGAALAALKELDPEPWVALLRALAEQVATTLPAEMALALQARLVEVLATLALGFFAQKSAQTRAFNMDTMTRMGHDIKTPINAVTGFSKVMLKGIDGPITEFQEEDLTSIYNAGNKLLSMIDDTFKVAKADAAKVEFYEGEFEMADLLGDILSIVQPLIGADGHALEVQCAGELGTMQANPSVVRWVVLGLLFEAVAHADPGALLLSVSRQTDGENGDWFIIEVSHTRTRAAELGNSLTEMDLSVQLMTCQRFSAELGGRLTLVEKEQGAGKVFLVRLPAIAPHSEI